MLLKELRKVTKGQGWTYRIEKVPWLLSGKKHNRYIAERISGAKVYANSVQGLNDFVTGVGHTPECWAATVAKFNKMDEYWRTWPNACRTCNGNGGFVSYYDPSPAGVGLSSGSMEDYDICEDCLNNGICPRCGKVIGDPDIIPNSGENVVCPHCNWVDQETEGMPDYTGYDCGCN